MRIVVSGTHCTGKSTLAEDFVAAHPEYVHEPEPYEWLVEWYGEAPDFERQLELSVERLCGYGPGAKVLAERSPLDFLAYMRAASGDTGGPLFELAMRGMEHVDLLVLLPIEEIDAPEDEDPELREAMHEQLIELVAGWDGRMLELHGDRRRRLAALEQLI
ncbi:MAG TPA: ATP-binding protein [Thermoanaerobaculia bacterium]|nr:ATP-binding protein [Thermoanaerobaculia bacterium]